LHTSARLLLEGGRASSCRWRRSSGTVRVAHTDRAGLGGQHEPLRGLDLHACLLCVFTAWHRISSIRPADKEVFQPEFIDESRVKGR